jgi:hypothetical protein
VPLAEGEVAEAEPTLMAEALRPVTVVVLHWFFLSLGWLLTVVLPTFLRALTVSTLVGRVRCAAVPKGVGVAFSEAIAAVA